MKKMVRNWIIKAENDLKTAKDEFDTEDPATDAVCFHAQQCVEKYLKAFLVFSNREFRKTHNIAEILTLCIEINPSFEKLKELRIHELTVYATELRYPEFFHIPSEEEAKSAIEMAERVKEFVLRELKEI